MSITAEIFFDLVRAMGGRAQEDISWSENIEPPKNSEGFALEAIFVICNSGMKNTVARQIYEKVTGALFSGRSSSDVFGHAGKCRAIDFIWAERDVLFTSYFLAPDKLEFCASLPWIGGITKYHLAKNFGANVAKPDVHLQRLANRAGVGVQKLCDDLAAETGLRSATIDVVLWRACANGLINSKTGAVS
jgi:hypothetical protein